ncbi:MAG: polysaccharide biosynthesis C-terminal domain-containing protein [Candidatus Aegiribacteria sp.]|nr:polysaccharide biosynthesis C-terminal domain-containing protein [Candidatus Aegiribacteria sp.]
MSKVLNWLGSAKTKGAGFSFLSLGNMLIAFITYLRFAEIARIFGTTWQTDAVSIAMVIPLLLQQLISTAFSSAFMPIYSRVRLNQGNDAANRLISRIINWMSLTGVVFIGLVLASGSLAIRIVGPGIEPSTTILATKLLWVFLPLIFLNAIEGVLQNFLNYGKRYGLVSFVRVLQILVSYLVIICGHGKFGVMIIPVSGLIGAFVSFFVCALITFRLNLRLRLVLDPGNRDFKELVRLAVPIIIGTLTGFLGPVADKALASFLRASSVTAIDYASRIKNLIRMVLIQPVLILSAVSFSRIAAEKNLTKLKGEIASFIKYISYYTVPASGILMVLSVPLISILFQRGNFGPEESRRIGYTLAFYSPWFAQLGIGRIVDRAFYSLKETITPVVLGIWCVLANILLNVILLQPLGIYGLALATTLTSGAKTLFLMYFLRKKLGGINGSDFVPEYLKFLFSAAVMIGYLLLSSRLFPVDLNTALSERIFKLSLSIVPGIIIYVAITALVGSKTFGIYLDMVKRILLSGKKKLHGS